MEQKPYISFFGGEPTINFPLIKRAMEYLQERRPDIAIAFTTNFVDVRAILEDLVRFNVRINVSQDGPKEVHDKYRVTKNKKPTFDIIQSNLAALEAISPGFLASNVLLNATIWDRSDLPRVLEYFIQQNDKYKGMFVGFVQDKGMREDVREQHVSDFSSFDTYLSYGLTYIQHIAEGREPPKVLTNLFLRGLRGIHFLSKEKLENPLQLENVCYPGERSIFVDTDGEFYICEKMSRTHQIGDYELGVVSGSDESMMSSLVNIRNTLCSDCWTSRLCNPCFEGAKDEGGMSIKGLEEMCFPFKGTEILNIVLYAQLSLIDTQNRRKEYFINTERT